MTAATVYMRMQAGSVLQPASAANKGPPCSILHSSTGLDDPRSGPGPAKRHLNERITGKAAPQTLLPPSHSPMQSLRTQWNGPDTGLLMASNCEPRTKSPSWPSSTAQVPATESIAKAVEDDMALLQSLRSKGCRGFRSLQHSHSGLPRRGYWTDDAVSRAL